MQTASVGLEIRAGRRSLTGKNESVTAHISLWAVKLTANFFLATLDNSCYSTQKCFDRYIDKLPANIDILHWLLVY